MDIKVAYKNVDRMIAEKEEYNLKYINFRDCFRADYVQYYLKAFEDNKITSFFEL